MPKRRSKEAVHREIRGRVLQALAGRGQQWAAQKAGIPKSSLSRAITTPYFSVELLVAIAPVLGVDVCWLVQGDVGGRVDPVRALEVLRRIEEAVRWGKS